MGVSLDFPMHLWDCLLLQLTLKLNLIWPSNVASTIFMWQYIHGTFNFAAHLQALLGCAVEVYEYSVRKRMLLRIQSIDDTLVVPSNTRFQKKYAKKTQMFLKHEYIMQPAATPTDAIIKALSDVKAAINK